MSSVRLSVGVKLGYGLGAVGTGVFSTVPGLLLTFYMTDTLGISALLAGLAVFLPKLWDVVSDPLMGIISDRTVSRWGRRRPYLLAGGVLLPLCFALLFSTPAFASPLTSFVYVLIAFTLCATAFTLFTVPYVAMPAEMTRDYNEGSSLMGYRMAFLTVGILAGGAIAPMLVKNGGGGRPGYALMAVVIAVVIGLAMVGSFFGTRRAPQEPAETRTQHATPWLEQIAAALRSPYYPSLLKAHFIVQVAIGCTLANVPYLAKYVVGPGTGFVPEDLMTLLFVCLVVPTIVMMPPWVMISRRIGKRRSYAISILIFAFGALLLWFARSVPLWTALSFVGVIGIGFAGTQLHSFAMLPDTIQAEHALSGERRDGVFSGLWLAADKGGIALGGFLAAQVLALTGFLESQGELVTQPDSAVVGILSNASFLPAAAFLLGLVALRGYRLSRAELARLVSEAPAGT